MANGKSINQTLSQNPGSGAGWGAARQRQTQSGGISPDGQNLMDWRISLAELNLEREKLAVQTENNNWDDDRDFLSKIANDILPETNLSSEDKANIFLNVPVQSLQGQRASEHLYNVFNLEGNNNRAVQKIMNDYGNIPNKTIADSEKVLDDINALDINTGSTFYKNQVDPFISSVEKSNLMEQHKIGMTKTFDKLFKDFPGMAPYKGTYLTRLNTVSDVEEIETLWNDALSQFKTIYEKDKDAMIEFTQWINSADFMEDYFKVEKFTREAKTAAGKRQANAQLNILNRMRDLKRELTPQERIDLTPYGGPIRPSHQEEGAPQFLIEAPKNDYFQIGPNAYNKLHFNRDGKVIPYSSGRMATDGGSWDSEITFEDAKMINQYFNSEAGIKAYKQILQHLYRKGTPLNEEVVKKYNLKRG